MRKHLYFFIALCIASTAFSAFAGTYKNPALPDVRNMLKIFFNAHTVKPPTGLTYNFEKRPEGWFVKELIPEGMGYKVARADTLWLLKTRQYSTIGKWEKWDEKQDKEAPDYDLMLGAPSDYMMYTYSPAYGYAGWEDDAIRLLNPARAELDDTMLYVLARAYSDKATDVYYDRFLSGSDIAAFRKKQSDKEKQALFLASENEAIAILEKIKNHDKNFPTAVGRISMKWSNEIMFCWMVLQMYAHDAAAAKKVLRAELYDPFILQAGRRLLNLCPQNAILFCQGDNDFWPLLYLQAQMRAHPDVRLVSTGLLPVPEYAGALQKDLFGNDALKMALPDNFFTGKQTPYVYIRKDANGSPIKVNEFLNGLKNGNFNDAEMECSAINTHNFVWEGSPAVTWNCSSSFIYASDIFMMDIMQNNSKPLFFYGADRKTIPVFQQQFIDEGLVQHFAPITRDSADKDRIKTTMIAFAQIQEIAPCPEHRHVTDNIRITLSHLIDYRGNDKMRLSATMLENFQKNMMSSEYFVYPDKYTLNIINYCQKNQQEKIAQDLVSAALDYCDKFSKDYSFNYFEVYDARKKQQDISNELRTAKQDFSKLKTGR